MIPQSCTVEQIIQGQYSIQSSSLSVPSSDPPTALLHYSRFPSLFAKRKYKSFRAWLSVHYQSDNLVHMKNKIDIFKNCHIELKKKLAQMELGTGLKFWHEICIDEHEREKKFKMREEWKVF